MKDTDAAMLPGERGASPASRRGRKLSAPRRFLRAGLLLALIVQPAAAAMAGEVTSGAHGMPPSFPVSVLSIEVSRQTGNAAYAPLRVHLSGADGGSLGKAGTQQSFPYPPGELVALLNALFELHFFDLPSRYANRPAAQLNADGSVSLNMMESSSSTANSVCVRVASFEKCVRYGNAAPLEIERLVSRVVADAQRLTAEH
jgi:hypothetical protein